MTTDLGIGLVVGIVVTLIGAVASYVRASVLRRRKEADDWRKEGADVTAGIETWVLENLSAENLRSLTHDERLEAVAVANQNWLSLKRDLRWIGRGHPLEGVTDACSKVVDAVDTAISAAQGAMWGEAPAPPPPDVQTVLRALHGVERLPSFKSRLNTSDKEREAAWQHLATAGREAHDALDNLDAALRQ